MTEKNHVQSQSKASYTLGLREIPVRAGNYEAQRLLSQQLDRQKGAPISDKNSASKTKTRA